MSTKKSRKRAYIPPSHEVVNRRERDMSVSRTTKASRPARSAGGRAAQAPPKPSLVRTAKRLPLYFILIFALQAYLLNNGKGDRSTAQIILFAAGQAAVVTLVFAPFMHAMDRFAYNRFLKRQGGVTPK